MRAQTTLDFAIGISVFLVAISFVFAFVPGMLQPFEDSAPETTTFGNRVAKQLVGGMLVEPGEEPVLDINCTVEFFIATPTGSPPSPFDQSVDVPGQRDPAFVDRLGVTDRQRFSVTVEGDYDGDGTVATLCWDGDTDHVVEETGGDCDPGTASDVLLNIANHDPPTRTGSVVGESRVGDAQGVGNGLAGIRFSIRYQATIVRPAPYIEMVPMGSTVLSSIHVAILIAGTGIHT